MITQRIDTRWAVAIAGATVIAACGGGSDGGSQSTGFSVVGAIAQIPASVLDADDESAELHVADIAGASEAMGLERPSDPNDADQTIEWYVELTRTGGSDDLPGIFVPQFELIGTEFVRDYDAYVAELGFGIAAIDTIAEVRTFPERFTVVTGDVTVAAGLPEVAPGVKTVGEGDDLELVFENDRTPLRPLQRPLRVAERDGVFAASLTTDAITAWLSGSGSSLADTERFGSVAAALDDIGVVTAYVYSTGDKSSPSGGIGAADAVGIGWKLDGGEPLAAVVFHHESEAVASAELDVIRSRFAADSLVTGDPLSTILTLDSVDASGSNVIAQVRFADGIPPVAIYNQLIRLDLPFVTI